MRFDDHRGWVPGKTVLREQSLQTMLVRTKTTGPDKTVTGRPVRVATAAFLRREGWLAAGWELWQLHAPWPRDHLLVT